MKYQITHPTTDKEGLLNALKMIQNHLTNGNVSEADYALTDLIDSVQPERVQFAWDSPGAAARHAKAQRDGIAAFALANPNMVD